MKVKSLLKMLIAVCLIFYFLNDAKVKFFSSDAQLHLLRTKYKNFYNWNH